MKAYSLYKWIEFKDEKKRYDLLKSSDQVPIFDEDIYEDQVSIEDNEEDIYLFSLIHLLLAMSYSFMELRHYKEAIDCLNECVSLSGETLAEPYFRRSQARLYNKFSDEDQLMLALADIQKAKSISSQARLYKRFSDEDQLKLALADIQKVKSISNENIFQETYDKVISTIEQKKTLEMEKIKCIFLFIIDLLSNINFEICRKDILSVCDHKKKVDFENFSKHLEILKE
jgi:hypothetical protein